LAHIQSLSCHRADFTLVPPLESAHGVWRERATLQIRLEDAAGHHGRGEAAPLPGYSPDSVEACEAALSAIPAARLSALSELTSPAALLQGANALVPREVPAARFALETALLDRLGRMLGRPLWSLLREALGERLGSAAPQPLELCVLLPSGAPAPALAGARRHMENGVRHFKIKIGPEQVQPMQLTLLDALRSRLGAVCSLRFDANRSLTRARLGADLRRLAAYQPEFIEEPVADPTPLDFADPPCPLALDESLQSLDSAQLVALVSLPSCRALVLKPTALGGFSRAAALAGRARAFGKAAVVSHTFEGPVGWLACAHLALALAPGPAAGLWPASHQQPGAWLENGRLRALERPGLGIEA
jgi:o-succinylbenzoate synthase